MLVRGGEHVADLVSVARAAGIESKALARCASLRCFLELGAGVWPAIHEVLDSYAGETSSIHDLRLGPPIADPQKIICLGLNYRDHALEAGMAIPDSPVVFAKYANSLAGPFSDIVLPAASADVDYEAELAVVIGQTARHVTPDEALQYVAGAMAFNDVSARDLQLSSSQWTLGKAIDTFGPCGPALVTLDELDDLHALGVRTRLNGEIVQDGNTADMIFRVADVIALLSSVMTLEPGDILVTGTPAGVGMGRTPPLNLKPGDIVEVEIEGIGALHNAVVAESSR